PRDAAQELVNEAEVAHQKPHEWNPAAIEMGEIDPAAEDTAAAIFRMVERAAAQDRDIARRIEGREVDRDLHCLDRGFVFGIEETRIFHGQEASLAPAFETDLAEIEGALSDKFRQQLCAVWARQQHGVAEVMARRLVRKHAGEKDALIDLDALLVALWKRTFGGDLIRRRRQPGDGG